MIELDGKRVEIFTEGQYDIALGEPSEDGLKEIWATGKVLDVNSSGRFFRDYLSGRYRADGYKVLYKVYGIGNDKFDYRYFTGPRKEGATKGKYYQGVPLTVLESEEVSLKSSPIPNFYNFADSFGNCRHEGGVDFRSGKKPIAFLKMLLDLETSSDEECLIIDFFAGSASTAHAVLDKNREDGRDRRFIMVQIPELIEGESFPDIAEIGKERIRRVITQMTQRNEGKLEGFEQHPDEDLGFRVFKLDRSSMRQWEELPANTTPEDYTRQLEMFVKDPLLEGWTIADVIAEVALKEAGFMLSYRVEQVADVTELTVYRVTDDDKAQSFYICLDDKLSLDALKPLNLARDDLFIFRDRAVTDTIVANLALTCRVKSI